MKTLKIIFLLVFFYNSANTQNNLKLIFDLKTEMSPTVFKLVLECSKEKSAFYSTMETKFYTSTFGKTYKLDKNDKIISKDTSFIDEKHDKEMNELLKKKNNGNKSIKPQVIKDYHNNNYYFKTKVGFYADTNYIKVPKEAFNWKLINETKIILNQKCKKATCSWLGRDYIAWYCPSIAVSDGPYKFKGLPGIILEIFDDEYYRHYTCTQIISENNFTPFIYEIPKISISLTEFKTKARAGLLKFEEVARSQNQLNNSCTTCPKVEFNKNIFSMAEREWLDTNFK